MGTMNVSLPGSLRDFVEQQVRTRGYGSASEYVRALIRADLEHQRLRERLLEGAASPPGACADADYFARLRARAAATPAADA